MLNSGIAWQHCDFHVFHILHIRWHGFYNIINVWLSHYSILKYQYDLLMVELTCVRLIFDTQWNTTNMSYGSWNGRDMTFWNRYRPIKTLYLHRIAFNDKTLKYTHIFLNDVYSVFMWFNVLLWRHWKES